MIWLIVLVLISPLPSETIKCKNSRKSYFLTPDLKGSSTCKSGNCLLQSQISVIERNHFDEYLNFTLISYGIKESESRTIGLGLTKPVSSTNPVLSNTFYSCSKQQSGLTSAKATFGSLEQKIGSSIFLNGNLYCTWIASSADTFWPIDGTNRADLVRDKSYQLYLQLESSKIMVANDSSSLPIYRRQYTQNCDRYRVIGKDNYQLVTIRSNDQQSTDFMLQSLGATPYEMKLILKQSDGTSLIVSCSFAQLKVQLTGNNGNVIHGALKNTKIQDSRCLWTLPDKIKMPNQSTINIELKRMKNVQIEVDALTVYNESNVALTGFSSQILPNLLIIVFSIFLSFSIH